jgi:hypothetical protein|tara:strand:- start:894 stop:1199 length:306 start_codon:yes stop_codon:yes gene_type:complete
MKTRKEENDLLNNLYNNGEISLRELDIRRDALKEMPDSKFAKTPTVKKKAVVKELSYEDKVLIQLKMQNDNLGTIKGILYYFLFISLLGIIGYIIVLSSLT